MKRLLILVAATAGLNPAARAADDKPTVVPFTLLPSRHMLVEVKVNGKGPFKLIFDTGAPINLVSPRLAKEAGIKGGGFSLFAAMEPKTIDKLTLGGVVVEKVPAVVIDHPTVKAIADAFREEHGDIDGIVGFPVFARFATTIDYQKRELAMTPTDYKPGDLMQDLTKALMSASDRGEKPRVVGPAGLWGVTVGKDTDDDEPGVAVRQVFAEGPAAAGGLKVGDRVLTVDGRWTDSLGEAYLATSLVKPGRKVDVVVKRDGKELTLTVTPVKGY